MRVCVCVCVCVCVRERETESWNRSGLRRPGLSSSCLSVCLSLLPRHLPPPLAACVSGAPLAGLAGVSHSQSPLPAPLCLSSLSWAHLRPSLAAGHL